MFWSPDSRFIAFDAAGQLKKIDVQGRRTAKGVRPAHCWQ